ncbi:MAG TPA: response regulator transcription factor [Acidobacteriota bacterium]
MTESPTAPILIVEDDPKTAALLALYLERQGFSTTTAADGEQALSLASELGPILIILDLMIPRLDGWQVCRRIREGSQVPILILTARDEAMDRVLGLSLGADDYVVKPFSPQEVVARVQAILRRARPGAGKPPTALTFAGLELDLDKRRLSLNGKPVPLTPAEFRLLRALMAEPGKVFSREELLEQLYPGGESVVDRVIDVHIGKLRQKIEPDPAAPRWIQTVRGFGYQFAGGERGTGR